MRDKPIEISQGSQGSLHVGIPFPAKVNWKGTSPPGGGGGEEGGGEGTATHGLIPGGLTRLE